MQHGPTQSLDELVQSKKQILVESLQADGHKVGMTGDGVNDILAMKKRDCSIAMNTGHDATKKGSSGCAFRLRLLPHAVDCR